MGARIDLTGRTFGRLTVLSQLDADDHGLRWLCQCSCGRYKAIPSRQLRAAKFGGTPTLSCGCLRRERTAETMREWHTRRSAQQPATAEQPKAARPRRRYNAIPVTEEDIAWMTPPKKVRYIC